MDPTSCALCQRSTPIVSADTSLSAVERDLYPTAFQSDQIFGHYGVAIEGSYTLPELARLSLEDQVFVTAFLRSHGSIKEMEQIFGVSYPTIKARLNRISGQLQFIDTNPSPSRAEVLERLKNGDITTEEAIAELEALK